MKELMDIKRWGQSKWRMPLIVAVLAVCALHMQDTPRKLFK